MSLYLCNADVMLHLCIFIHKPTMQNKEILMLPILLISAFMFQTDL